MYHKKEEDVIRVGGAIYVYTGNGSMVRACFVQSFQCVLYLLNIIISEQGRETVPMSLKVYNITHPFLSVLLIAGCDVGVQLSVHPSSSVNQFISLYL